MKKLTTVARRRAAGTSSQADGAFEPLGPDALSDAIRTKVRDFIRQLVDEELEVTLGAGNYQRNEGRRGYRHGSEQRRLGTSLGPVDLDVPRARLKQPEGGSSEFRSRLLPRYSRRARAVDNAIIGAYLGGVNTRKLRGALRPLLRGTALSKSAVSRIVTRLKAEFDTWKLRRLDDEGCVYLYLDGFGVKVRAGGQISRMTVLCVVGVKADGTKVLLALDLAGSEAEDAWRPVLDDLVARGLCTAKLCVTDGCVGLENAIAAVWGNLPVQRCAVHKLRNLLAKAPVHAQDAIKDDFHAIMYAANKTEARAAYERFVSRWRGKCQKVVDSLQEAGDRLLTFYDFPPSQWRALRTTNVIERLNGEFRRRIKTQSSLPSEQSVLVLLFSLVASGHVRLRRIDGWQDMAHVATAPLSSAA